MTTTGTYSGTLTFSLSNHPEGMTISSSGSGVLVGVLVGVCRSGKIVRSKDNGLTFSDKIKSISIDPLDNVWVLDESNQIIQNFYKML